MDCADIDSRNNLILQFVDKNVLVAITVFSLKDASIPALDQIQAVAETFCSGSSSEMLLSALAGTDPGAEQKLIDSFYNNLKLLVEKTWVEPSDAAVKDQVLYQIDKVHNKMEQRNFADCYVDFVNLLADVVYLLFGPQSKKDDFQEYALRIDPEFGIFWWYVQSLPKTSVWENEKSRAAVLLGMYFLANY